MNKDTIIGFLKYLNVYSTTSTNTQEIVEHRKLYKSNVYDTMSTILSGDHGIKNLYLLQ